MSARVSAPPEVFCGVVQRCCDDLCLLPSASMTSEGDRQQVTDTENVAALAPLVLMKLR